MTEFAFDIKLIAVGRVQAETEEEARRIINSIDAIDLGFKQDSYRLTEASIQPGSAFLFQVGDEEVE